MDLFVDRVRLKETLETLQRQVDLLRARLMTHLTDGAFHYLPDVARGGTVPMEAGVNALCSLDFPVDRNDGLTRRQPGIIGVLAEDLPLIEETNLAKESFAKACQALQARKEGRAGRELVKRSLQDLGRSTLSLRQAYRKLLVTTERPTTVSFTTSHKGRAIEEVSREHAVSWLRGNDEQVAHGTEVLMSLDKSLPLYVSYPLNPHFRVNLRFPDGSTTAHIAHSPLLVPLQPGQDLNWYPLDPSWTPRDRQIRADKQISDQPLIPGTRIYTLEHERACPAITSKAVTRNC